MAYNIYKDVNKMTNEPSTATMNIVSVSVGVGVLWLKSQYLSTIPSIIGNH